MNSNNPNSDQPPIAEQDDWLAFQYLVGELSAEETQSFEQQLEENESAQQALADAVQLVGLLREAMDPASPISPTTGPNKIQLASSVQLASSPTTAKGGERESIARRSSAAFYAAMILATVAGVAVIGWLGWRSFSQPASSEIVDNDANHSEPTEQLANIWMTSLDNSDGNGESNDDNGINELFEPDLDQHTLVNGQATTESESAWMVDALKEFGGGALSPNDNSMSP